MGPRPLPPSPAGLVANRHPTRRCTGSSTGLHGPGESHEVSQDSRTPRPRVSRAFPNWPNQLALGYAFRRSQPMTHARTDDGQPQIPQHQQLSNKSMHKSNTEKFRQPVPKRIFSRSRQPFSDLPLQFCAEHSKLAKETTLQRYPPSPRDPSRLNLPRGPSDSY